MKGKDEPFNQYPRGVDVQAAYIVNFPEWVTLPNGKGLMRTTIWRSKDIHGRVVQWTRIETVCGDEPPVYEFVNMIVVRTGEVFHG